MYEEILDCLLAYLPRQGATRLAKHIMEIINRHIKPIQHRGE